MAAMSTWSAGAEEAAWSEREARPAFGSVETAVVPTAVVAVTVTTAVTVAVFVAVLVRAAPGTVTWTGFASGSAGRLSGSGEQAVPGSAGIPPAGRCVCRHLWYSISFVSTCVVDG